MPHTALSLQGVSEGSEPWIIPSMSVERMVWRFMLRSRLLLGPHMNASIKVIANVIVFRVDQRGRGFF